MFSLDSFKSRHPVLEFSNHHQHNLQSEHTESQCRPAHLLILAETLHLSCHLRAGGLHRAQRRAGCKAGQSMDTQACFISAVVCCLKKKSLFILLPPPLLFNLKLNEDLSRATALQA